MTTQTVTIKAEDGTDVTLVVPFSLPTEERANYLRKLYGDHVKTYTLGADWREACCATVPAALADDMAKAMDFMGSKVDSRQPLTNGEVLLHSRGYWAHGF